MSDRQSDRQSAAGSSQMPSDFEGLAGKFLLAGWLNRRLGAAGMAFPKQPGGPQSMGSEANQMT